jgi:hypothetical protein
MKTLKETKSSNDKFAKFLKAAFKEMNDPSNDLASLLVTPVQRIPRYLMLVRSMLKHTWEEHVDYADLKSAEEKISTIAIIVDQKAKDAENVQMMHHLENILEGNDFPLLDPQRRFIKKGFMLYEKKKSRNIFKKSTQKEIFGFLFSDLLIFASQNSDQKTYAFRSRHMLIDCALEDVEEKERSNSLKLLYDIKDDEYFILSFKDERDKKGWKELLEECMDENNQKFTTLRNVRKMQNEKKREKKVVQASGWKHVAGDSVPLKTEGKPAPAARSRGEERRKRAVRVSKAVKEMPRRNLRRERMVGRGLDRWDERPRPRWTRWMFPKLA